MTDAEKLEWAREHPDELVSALCDHEEGPMFALSFVDGFHRAQFVDWMTSGTLPSKGRVVIEAVDKYLANEALAPDPEHESDDSLAFDAWERR